MISVNQWVYDLEKKIFSIVKSRASEKLSGKYPNIYFTDIEQNTSKACFLRCTCMNSLVLRKHKT